MEIDWNVFVEANLTGVSTEEDNKSINIFVTDTNNKKWIITAKEVDSFIVTEMRLQNIIDRITPWDATVNELECRRHLFCIRNGHYPSDNDDIYSQTINDGVDAINSKGFILLEVEPVYGALVLILASTFDVSLSE